MNENKRIDNLQIKIVNCVGAKAQHEKCVGTLQKQTMGIIFNIQNWRIHGQNRPVANLPVVDFRSQPRENSTTKATEYVFFCFFSPYLGFLPFLVKVWTSLSARRWRLRRSFINLTDWRENASDVSAADWRYQTQVKKYDIFLSVRFYGFSHNLLITILL